MKAFAPERWSDVEGRAERLERQLVREREARREAEAIAERGLRELYDSQRRLALLQRITEAANRAADVEAALKIALAEICSEMDWDFGNAYRIDRTGTLPEAIACDCAFVARPEHMLPFVEASRGARFECGIGLPGRVLASGEACWIQDVRTDSNFLRRDTAEQCRVISGCAFPILVGNEVAAIIEFFSRRAITDRDALVGTMAQIAVQLGRVVERERARETLLHDSLHDALTGLANRVHLRQRLASASVGQTSNDGHLAVLTIDVNGFKAVNDRHGHQAGDCVLVEVARRLERTLARYRRRRSWRDALLTRTAADEYVILLEGIESEAAPAALTEAIHRAMVSPIQVGSQPIQLDVAIGLALTDAEHADAEHLIRDSSLALQAAKHGSTASVTFTPQLGEAVRNRRALEQEIRDGIREHQFVMHYQPIFQLGASPRLDGYEALVRWNHPVRGMLSPGEFIAAAEETGLIVFLGDWALRESCAAMARLHRALPGKPLPFIAVNIAPQQFLQPDFAAQVERVLIETGLPPRCLKLEVTEGVAIIDAERTRRVLEQVRSWGVRTGLDDFGTGYSSLSYLHTLPFDTLKIDRSFIATLHEAKGRNIVRTILDLAGNLDLMVVAEGIETSEQEAMLGTMGCHLGQGYLLGRPLAETQAFALAA